MKIRVVSVDPDTAMDWLTANTHNRPISKGYVGKLVSDMKGGRWQDNGETVKFDVNGVLLDGQHRLMAVVESGITIPMIVVEGLPPESQGTIDIGRVRTAAHILTLNGVANSSLAAAMSSQIIRYLGQSDNHSGMVWTSTNNPTKTEVVEFAMENENKLQEAIVLANVARGAFKVSSSTYGVLAFLVHDGSRHIRRWDSWHEGCCTGALLERGDARLAYRNYNLRTIGKRLRGSWQQQEQLGIAIKAWNQWALNKPSQVLRYNQNELPLPKIR